MRPSIAWGITSVEDGADTADRLLDAADRAMYQHKSAALHRLLVP